jgi:hypothetical protein
MGSYTDPFLLPFLLSRTAGFLKEIVRWEQNLIMRIIWKVRGKWFPETPALDLCRKF